MCLINRRACSKLHPEKGNTLNYLDALEYIIEDLKIGANDDELRDKTPKEREFILCARIISLTVKPNEFTLINDIPKEISAALREAIHNHFSELAQIRTIIP